MRRPAGLVLIDKEGIVHHELINDPSLGRSVGEAMNLTVQRVDEYPARHSA